MTLSTDLFAAPMEDPPYLLRKCGWAVLPQRSKIRPLFVRSEGVELTIANPVVVYIGEERLSMREWTFTKADTFKLPLEIRLDSARPSEDGRELQEIVSTSILQDWIVVKLRQSDLNRLQGRLYIGFAVHIAALTNPELK